MSSDDAMLATSLIRQVVGQSFIQLCLGSGDAQLIFTGDCTLQLDSHVRIGTDDGPLLSAYEPPGVTSLLPLLSDAVTAVHVSASGELTTTIGDTTLWCGSSPDFEAWNFSGPRGELVVSTAGGALAISTAGE